MLGIVLLGLVALWGFYYTVVFALNSYRLRNFRGPLAFPVVGNLYTAEAFQVLRYVQKLKKTYGNWFVFWGLSKPMIVCTDPVGVREILSDTKTFVKGPDYTHYFAVAFGQGLVTSTGEKHKVDRGRLGKYFIKSSVAQYAGVINAHVKKAMATMIGDNVKDATINFEHFFAHLTLRVFGEFCLHHDFSQDVEVETRICKLVSKGSYQVGFCITTGLPTWSFLPWTKAIHGARDAVVEVCTPIVEARKKALKEGAEVPDDPLTAMLQDNISDQDLWDHMVTLVCAGHDTTAFFASYTAMLLAQNADCQEKLREEIVTVIGDRDNITEADLDKLVYMRKVFQEVLRIFPVIPAISRVATKDVTIKETGVTVPAGVNVLMPVVAMHRSPDIWEAPEVFNPERWAENTVFRNDPKIGYLPFGYGSRTCIGMSLALTEAGIFFCDILRKYRLSPEPGFRPRIVAGISLTTSNGMLVRVSSL